MENSFKEQCIELRKQDYSVMEIMRITGRAKTSIYTHIRDIPLSSQRIQKFKTVSGERIRSFALARKGKSERSFKKFTFWTKDLVLLVGHLTFDGGLRHGICEYNNRSEILVQRVEKLMKTLYDFEPKRYLNQITGVIKTSYFNVPLASYLKEKSQELLSGIGDLDSNLQKEYLRAFFDDEGCMDFRPAKNHRRIRGYQKDVRTLSVVHDLLQKLGIDSHIEMPNEIVISGKHSMQRFQREINFSEGVRINGNRSNSIWKEHLEKRLLLQMAIDSFQS